MKTGRSFESLDLKKILRKENMIVLVLIGVLLLVVTFPIEDFSSDTTKEDDKEIFMGDSGQLGEDDIDSTDLYEEANGQYVTSLEKRVEEILCNIDGVGTVDVMITLKSSKEYVVEKDVPSTQKTVTETDSQGGSRDTNENQSDEVTIYTTDASGNKIPYVIKINEPEIQGITVVAQGGGNPTVKSEITAVLSALFSLDVHKIMVVKMK